MVKNNPGSLKISKIKVEVDDNEGNYDELIAQIPEQRVRIQSISEKPISKASIIITLHVASAEKLTNNEILEITTYAARYKGKKVFYSSKNSALPVCRSQSTGFKTVSSNVNGVDSSYREINISNKYDLTQSPCLFLVEIQPNLESSIGLVVNDQVLLDKSMNKKERFQALFQKQLDQATQQQGIGSYPFQ